MITNLCESAFRGSGRIRIVMFIKLDGADFVNNGTVIQAGCKSTWQRVQAGSKTMQRNKRYIFKALVH